MSVVLSDDRDQKEGERNIAIGEMRIMSELKKGLNLPQENDSAQITKLEKFLLSYIIYMLMYFR